MGASTAHPGYSLAGPGIWIVAGAMGVVALGAFAVIVHAAVRPGRFRGPAHRLAWAMPQALYLLILLLGFVFGGRGGTVVALGVVLPVAGIAQIAYLLRIVFPKPRGPGADGGAEEVADGAVGADGVEAGSAPLG